MFFWITISIRMNQREQFSEKEDQKNEKMMSNDKKYIPKK